MTTVPWRRLATGFIAALCVGAAALSASCAPRRAEAIGAAATPDGSARVLLLSSSTLEGVGAAQGASFRDGLAYVFGDADTGAIRELRIVPARRGGDPPALTPTGRDVRLTRGGVDLAPHPTGLAFPPASDPGLGVFLADTVNRKGTIFRIDWERALADGTLDNAVLATINDDIAVNGSRPVYARWREPRTGRDRWVIATSDYGPSGNEVRLYDPERLAAASRTSEPGVLLARIPCGPWVQALHWIDERRTLLIVQNQIEGLRWRLAFARLDGASEVASTPTLDFVTPVDELEGMCQLTPMQGGKALAVIVTSSRADNLWVAEIHLPAR